MQSLVLPGTLDSLEEIAKYVEVAAAAAGLDKKAAYRLRLAVDEIATNIIVHGYMEASRDGSVCVLARVDDNVLEVCLEDTGVPFDPRDAPMPDDLDKPLEQRHIGGLGVYLATKNVDGYQYERHGDRNRNTFVVRRRPANVEGQG